MESIDLRRADEIGRFELRKRAIRMIKSGKKKKEVAALLGVNKNSITNWWKSYKDSGAKGLKAT